jgi:hypothetical protein
VENGTPAPENRFSFGEKSNILVGTGRANFRAVGVSFR